MKTVAVILAAGLGTRMKSRLPKVLHPVLGDPSLLWVLRGLPEGIDHALVVVHHGKAEVAARHGAVGLGDLRALGVPARFLHRLEHVGRRPAHRDEIRMGFVNGVQLGQHGECHLQSLRINA
jgi:NDP-sugar pyrophosphorylase family protein